MMLRIAIFCLLHFALLPVARADDAAVVASLREDRTYTAGERIIVVVELRAPGYFSGTPDFDLPKIPGAILMPSFERPAIGTETVDGNAFTTQRYELSLFVQRGGTITVPAISVRYAFNAGGTTAATVRQAMTQPLNIEIELPPDAKDVSPLISTNELSGDAHWSTDGHKATVGDAFTVTFTLTAANVPGMLLPPIDLPDLGDTGIYAKQPVVSDKIEHGNLTGSRTQTFTYICKQPGDLIIPAISMKWWDLDDKQLKTLHFPGRRIHVAAPPADAAAPVVPGERSIMSRIVPPLIFAAIGVPLILCLLKLAQSHSWWLREEATFIKFKDHSRKSSSRDVYHALMHWWEVASSRHAIPDSLIDYASSHQQYDLVHAIRELESSLYGPDSRALQRAEAKNLEQAASRFRRWYKRRSRQHRTSAKALAPLNPIVIES